MFWRQVKKISHCLYSKKKIMKIFNNPFTDLIFCGSCSFIEKITFASQGGQTTHFSSQPLNNKTAVEQSILKLGLLTFRLSFNI